MRVHHLGVACSDIESALTEFSKYHNILRKSEVVFDPIQNAYLCMVTSECGLDIEFISGEKVAKLVKKGVSYYHVCYETNDIDATYADFISKGALEISMPQPAVLFDGLRVAFLYLPYGLVELVEETGRQSKN